MHEAQSLSLVLWKKENLSIFRRELRGKLLILHLHSDQQKPGRLGLKQHLLQTTLSAADSLASQELNCPSPGVLHLEVYGGSSIKLYVKLIWVSLPHYPYLKAGPQLHSWQG